MKQSKNEMKKRLTKRSCLIVALVVIMAAVLGTGSLALLKHEGVGVSNLFSAAEKEKYYIQYMSNSGGKPATLPDPTIQTYEQYKNKDFKYDVSASVPTRQDGYTFVGWSYSSNTKPEDKDDLIAAGTKNVDFPRDKMNANNVVYLYAIWKEDKITITYDMNGGTYDGKDKLVVDTGFKSIDLPKLYLLDGYDDNPKIVPEREGYTFNNWAYEPNSYISKENVYFDENDKNITVYAIWKKSFNSTAQGTIKIETTERVFKRVHLTSSEVEPGSYMIIADRGAGKGRAFVDNSKGASSELNTANGGNAVDVTLYANNEYVKVANADDMKGYFWKISNTGKKVQIANQQSSKKADYPAYNIKNESYESYLGFGKVQFTRDYTG